MRGRADDLGRLLSGADPAPEPDRPMAGGPRVRRRAVVALTLAVGAVLMGLALSLRPGAAPFYPLTAALALVWSVGAWASGPIPIAGPRMAWRDQLLRPAMVGLAVAGVFVVAALVVREIPLLRDVTADVLTQARELSLPTLLAITVLNGLAEEAFFRGAVFDALIPGRTGRSGQPADGSAVPVAISTLLYTAVIAATGNVMLVFAAALLGLICAVQRRATGGVLAPMLTHITWSVTMLLVLPPLFPSS